MTLSDCYYHYSYAGRTRPYAKQSLFWFYISSEEKHHNNKSHDKDKKADSIKSDSKLKVILR